MNLYRCILIKRENALSSIPVSPQTIGFLTFAIFWKVNLPPGVLILFNLFDSVW